MFVGAGVEECPQVGARELRQGGVLHEDPVFGGGTAERE